MTRDLKARAGLTLIELVIALTIAGMSVSVGYAALGTLVDRRAAVEDVTAGTVRAWTARAMLSEWLSESHAELGGAPNTFRGLDGSRDGSPDDELTFLTTARTPLGDGETLVRLYVARDSAGVAVGLAADLSDWRGTRRSHLIVDSTIVALDIRFRSSTRRAAPWLSSWVSSSILPAAIELMLHAAPGAAGELLRIPILVPLA